MNYPFPALIMLSCFFASCASQGSGAGVVGASEAVGSGDPCADAVTGATFKADPSSETRIGAVRPGVDPVGPDARKHALIVLYAPNAESSTAKAAGEIARVLDADVIGPELAVPEVLARYELIGFASGIFDQRHHTSILEAAERLPDADSIPAGGREGEKRFILFSTSGVSRSFALRHAIDDPHDALRSVLRKKRGTVVGEFNCLGVNKNFIFKYFGGMNRGRPNATDLEAARAFASEVLRNAIDSP